MMNQVPALMGDICSAKFADGFNQWCQDLIATNMLRGWQASILTLLETGGGTGFIAVRPTGLASLFQRVAARCMLRAIGRAPPRR